ncbi:MAG TPA: 30S ribosome-binding factor RbfA [Caulobacteraceae bacterium]
MPRTASKTRPGRSGPSQRQLRAGELVRHALVDILRHESFADPVLSKVSVTISEVKLSPDLRHAVCFIEPLGGANAVAVVDGLNRAARFLRGRLGHVIEMRFTPDLKFVHDDSFDAAAHMSHLLDDPRVRRDIEATPGEIGAEEEG